MTRGRVPTRPQGADDGDASKLPGTRPRMGDLLLDRYQIFGLREGGFGMVLFVTDIESEAEYAVKTYKPELAEFLPSVEEFRSEVAFWLQLPPHPNIVGARFVRTDGNRPLLFLDYESGGSLRDLLQQRGRLELEPALRFTHQICVGMEVVNRGVEVAHLDLKPENLLIASGDLIRVTDFGLSHRVRVLEGAYPRVESATWPYAAPERFAGEAGDSRTDIYSVGAILYEMLTAELPYPTDYESLRGFHRRQGLKSVSEELYYRGFPGPRGGELGRILSGCLCHYRESRVESFRELRQMLEHVFPELSDEGLAQEHSEQRSPVDTALGLQAIGRHAAALEAFNVLLASSPRDGRLWIAAARSAWAEGMHRTALNCLNRARDTSSAKAADELRRTFAQEEKRDE